MKIENAPPVADQLAYMFGLLVNAELGWPLEFEDEDEGKAIASACATHAHSRGLANEDFDRLISQARGTMIRSGYDSLEVIEAEDTLRLAVFRSPKRHT